MRQLYLPLTSIVLLVIIIAVPATVSAQTGDALINYKLALAAQNKGNAKGAYELFKKSCLAEGGITDACIAWSKMAAEEDNGKDVKRALGSAVILAPNDVRARAALALLLIEKTDFKWAMEHLEHAIKHVQDPDDEAMLRYYYAYALFKTEQYEKSVLQYGQSCPMLLDGYQQRCDFYKALITRKQGDRSNALELLKKVRDGEEGKWATAASEIIESWSSFYFADGFSGMFTASFGFNTYPASAFLDVVSTDANPVLQSVLRADAIFQKKIDSLGFQGVFTAYREQSWAEIGSETTAVVDAKDNDSHSTLADEFSPQDFNVTVFFLQGSLLTKNWGNKYEHELRIGVDGEMQFMDHPPIKDVLGTFHREDNPFAMIAWAAGGKIWWSFASNKDTVTSLRLKIEGRPNFINSDRSTSRFRFRAQQTRNFFNRKLRLKVMAGIRYDRSYDDPYVVKYDRLLPEMNLNIRWRTPMPRLTLVVSGGLKYNWYLNSRQNQQNSFRPKYVKIDFGDESGGHLERLMNSYFEKEYYDLTRQDLELKVNPEVQFSLWKGAQLALVYTYHQRISSIDNAPTGKYVQAAGPDHDTNPDSEAKMVAIPAPRYSYTRHQLMLELRYQF